MKKYIATAIPYVNAPPHIGHAMDYLLADIWARYERQQGSEVRFSTGTDEHGTKVAQKAAEAGVEPQQFVDKLVPKFQSMIKKMNISATDFIRTTDPDHITRVQEIWRKLDKAGLIYKSTYEGWYCVGCEGFVTETEARDMNYECPDHQKPFEKLSEQNYYLRVSQFTEQLREFARKNIMPEFRGREILELIKDGAQDVSISRPKDKLQWGIPVPNDETQTMYVWVDALSNYITVLGYPENEIGDWWPADVQVLGKDILRFHAIIWPTILLGLGLELPKQLLVHGHVLADGAKMSKSLGNVVDPNALIDERGAEAFRYYFARHIPTFEDGDYTVEKFIAAYNGELANDLGNLVSRTANMVGRFVGGSTDASADFTWDKSDFDKYMNDFRFDLALENVWGLVQHLNQYIDEKKPWEAAKNNEDVIEVMGYLVAGLRELSKLLAPFLPNTATKISEIFSGETVGDAPILFPRTTQ
jgi:methionyl-tRNA synthetase